MATGFYQINKDVYQYEVDLGWHNCYSFGNGVESDRIRDDFNAPTIDNGIKVSTTFVDYGQEDKTSGLTYSGGGDQLLPNGTIKAVIPDSYLINFTFSPMLTQTKNLLFSTISDHNTVTATES